MYTELLVDDEDVHNFFDDEDETIFISSISLLPYWDGYSGLELSLKAVSFKRESTKN